jgi:phosphatidate cytidylyltransferase
MLGWRLLLGSGLTIVLVALGWLDYVTSAAIPGLWLIPVLVFFGGLATREVLDLLAAAGIRPLAWAVYAGNLLVLASAWGPWAQCWLSGARPAPHLQQFHLELAGQPGSSGEGAAAAAGASGDWVLMALGAAVILVFVGEMRRFRTPGGVTANLAGGLLAIVYVGVLLSFAVRLRLAWGVGALASLLVVAKFGDTGAYFVGRLLGRHKMSPILSPKKTMEGAAGGLAFSLVASWATFGWLVPAMATASQQGVPRGLYPWWGWLVVGLAVGVAGIAGDLAESLLKRDSSAKDSGRWLPGLGGILDLLDSVLIASPVVYACWALRIVGP